MVKGLKFLGFKIEKSKLLVYFFSKAMFCAKFDKSQLDLQLSDEGYEIDPAWEDFGSLVEEQRLAEQRIEEPEPYDISQIADIFGDKFREMSGANLRTELVDKLGPMLMTEIKKVFVDETLVFVDYTYSKHFFNKGYLNRLNYLNLITNKGHIYSVQFKQLIGYGSTIGNCLHSISCPIVDNCYHLNYKIILAKYVETFKPTKTNWAMLKMYTLTNNGIEQKYREGIQRGEFIMGNRILTILSYLNP